MNQQSTSRWLVYLKERFPIIPNLIVAAGITFSAYTLIKNNGPIEHEGILLFLSLTGGMIFLAQMRFMDELKDIEKDKIAHPQRPLPRGLFTPQEFFNFITTCQTLMVAFTFVLFLMRNLNAGIFFGTGTFYLYLMYREFFMGQWLSKRAILYAITHQLIIYPLVFFLVSTFKTDAWNHSDSFWLATMILGGFFGFEVGRKLDPQAHPILNTYLLNYGKLITALLVTAVITLSNYSAFKIHCGLILMPFSILAISSLGLLWISPQKFKITEALVSLYLIVCIWSLPIMKMIEVRK